MRLTRYSMNLRPLTHNTYILPRSSLVNNFWPPLLVFETVRLDNGVLRLFVRRLASNRSRFSESSLQSPFCVEKATHSSQRLDGSSAYSREISHTKRVRRDKTRISLLFHCHGFHNTNVLCLLTCINSINSTD